VGLATPTGLNVQHPGLPLDEVLGDFSVRNGWRYLGGSMWQGRASRPSGEMAIVRLTFSSMRRVSVVELLDPFFESPVEQHSVDWHVAIDGLDDDALEDYWFDLDSGLVWPRRVSCHGRVWRDIPSLVERFNEKLGGGFGHWRLARHSELVRVLSKIRYDGKGELFRDSVGPPEGLWLDSSAWPVGQRGGVGVLVRSETSTVAEISFVPLSEEGSGYCARESLEFPVLLVSSHFRDNKIVLHRV
jgi:hypothetical protein